jgi:2-methylcitrate dehydratase PrpD
MRTFKSDAEDVSLWLSERAAGLEFDQLSPEQVETAKWGILDTLGVCLAATGGAEAYLDPVRRFLTTCPAGEVPAPTLGLKVGPLDGILWLGSLAHTLDFDDVAGYSHPSGPVVCASLVVGYDRVVDGRSLISAVALGQDLVIRLAQSVRAPISQYGWMPSMPGLFGATIATAKLLGLDPGETRSALGLALHLTSGTMQALARPGSAYRAVREGFNARAGAMAAYLAAEGLPGDHGSFEGQYGYFNQFFGGDYDEAFLRDRDLLGPLTSFKAWPCAGHPQLFVTALSDMIASGAIDVSHVETIRIAGCSDLLPHQCEPLELRAAPRASIDAKVSIPFLIGKILTHGTIGIEDFSPEGLDDPEAVALGRRVEWSLDSDLRGGMNDFGVGVVEVVHEDGRCVRGQASFPLGHPKNPLDWDDIVGKFRECLAAGAGDLSAAADTIVDAVQNLESLDDVSVLLDAAQKVAR